MRRVPVESSMLSSIGYDPVTETLEVEFVSGEVCQYFGVSKETHERLMKADSKGGFMNGAIMGAFRYDRVARRGRR